MKKDINTNSIKFWLETMGEDVQVIDKIPLQEKRGSPRAMKPPKELEIVSRLQADSVKNLEELEGVLRSFEGLSIIKTATNLVFADGNRGSSVMLIGEAPGATEDETGVPFCGESGKLLDQCLRSIGFSREKNFYITNSVFWRPPGNRKPTNDEIAVCRPFVEKHIALIEPKLLILVGATAVSAVLDKEAPMTEVRGQFFEYSNKYLTRPLTCTAIFHPSYLLRQPSQKKAMWHDLLQIEDFLANR